jgi:2-polyprenyl-3-methyl-5-hydroxy-6-metoxy-1,4-benzoquinol methylase
MWRLLPTSVRAPILRLLEKNNLLYGWFLVFYRWQLFRQVAAKDRDNGVHESLPPAELRYRVSGSAEADAFVKKGKTCAGNIQSALRKVGHELRSFSKILDFGCGCGRTLMHLEGLAPSAHFYGIDIDTKAIEWCRQNLKFGTFNISNETPPIEYASEMFDFIFAISVFTHLNEDYQFLWLEELQRIAQPGAILLLTVDSSFVGEQGFVFKKSYEKGLFPAWYQNASHSKAYVLANFSRFFEVLEYLPRGMNNHQDVVVLQKRNGITQNQKGAFLT